MGVQISADLEIRELGLVETCSGHCLFCVKCPSAAQQQRCDESIVGVRPRHSGRFAVVVPQNSAQPFATADVALELADLSPRLDDPVLPPLVIPLPMIMSEELPGGLLQRLLAEEDHPVLAFVLDRPHDPLDVRRQSG